MAQNIYNRKIITRATEKSARVVKNLSGGVGSSTPAGSDTQVQFNDGGVFGGDAGLTYNKTTDALSAGRVLVPNGTLASPPIAFSNRPNCGFYNRSTNQIGVVVDANLITETTLSGFTFSGSRALGWATDVTLAAPDLLILRDDANTLGQRNGINSQVFRLYKSFTDASNYTRSAWRFDANGVLITGESVGTGDANIDITFTPKGTGNVRFGSHSAVAAELITGYIIIKDSSGTLRKLAVIS